MRRQDKKHRTIRKCKEGPNFTGQHLLHHPNTIKRFVETAGLRPSDTVLEIGAGKGGLTFPLAEKAGKVLAVEIDANYVEALRSKAKGRSDIRIIHGDIREIRLPSAPFCVVANIPFAITTAILDKLLGADGRFFQKGTLMLEKGAARRFTEAVTLDPRLLKWRMNFRFEMKGVVPRSHFAPPPRVDAAIVTLARREHPLVHPREGKKFQAFAAYLLSEPRRFAAEALKTVFTPAQLRAALKNAEVDREQSVSSLSLEQWASLFQAMLRYAAPYRWPRL